MAEPCFSYVGSKKDVVEWILSFVTEKHDIWVEHFGGSGSVTLAKTPSRCEIFNDKSHLVSNFFEVIRTHPKEFVHQLELLPYSEILNRKFATEPIADLSNIEKAIRWYYLIFTSFHGKLNGGYARYKDATSILKDISSKIPSIEMVAKRFKNIQIWNKSFEESIPLADSEKTIHYLDPPYIETEFYYIDPSNPGIAMFSTSDHMLLAEKLHACKGKVILSYEDHPLLDVFYEREKGWHKFELNKNRNMIAKKAKEVVITNFKPLKDLFS